MTFAGEDLSKVGRNEFVPAKEFQKRWIGTYLKAFLNVEQARNRARSIRRVQIDVRVRIWLKLLVEQTYTAICSLLR